MGSSRVFSRLEAQRDEREKSAVPFASKQQHAVGDVLPITASVCVITFSRARGSARPPIKSVSGIVTLTMIRRDALRGGGFRSQKDRWIGSEHSLLFIQNTF